MSNGIGTRHSLLLLSCFCVASLVASGALAADPPQVQPHGTANDLIQEYNEAMKQLRGTREQSAKDNAAALKREKVAEDQLSQQAMQLAGIAHDLRNQVLDRCGLSPENVLPTILELEKQKFNLGIEVELKQLRRDQLEKLVKESSAKAISADDLANDPVAQDLQDLVALRLKTLQDAKEAAKAAAISAEELRQKQMELAEAKIRAERHKEGLIKAFIGEPSPYAQQLTELNLALTQDEARLAILSAKLATLNTVRDDVERYDQINGVELPGINQELQSLKTLIRKHELAS